MRSLEKFLIAADEGAWGAICRVALGLAMPLAFRTLSGGHDSIWGFLAFFLAVLIGLRVGPVIIRRVLPFSPQTRDIWAKRRTLAKRYDSYQWQKLFWIGLGLLPSVIAAQGTRPGELLITGLCLIGGGTGQLIWRKASANLGSAGARAS
jgi:hypothetical protein